MAATFYGNVLTLSGCIGPGSFYEDQFTHQQVLSLLAASGPTDDLTVRINSPGGHLDDALAIHNTLTARAGKVTTIVEGVALSAASLIAMAGDRISMAAGAVMMLHEPHTSVFDAD